jgi:hypothetical protein
MMKKSIALSSGMMENGNLKMRFRIAKPVIDDIDRLLTQHYGFTDEELDFIINYDIKYRMGGADGDEEGGATNS